MFITFEGLDFSGKTTQANLLVAALRPSRPVRFLRDPGGTRVSEKLRDILLDHGNQEIAPTTELMLFSAARAQMVDEIIRPALRAGEIVVCDRFCDSTTAYQGYGRGLDIPAILVVNRIATGGLVPDLTVFVDIPLEEIERRKNLAGKTFDRMEAAGKDFYERVRLGFLEIGRAEQHRWITVDGSMAPDAVHREVLRAVTRCLQREPQPV
jgi:dTMP kinase